MSNADPSPIEITTAVSREGLPFVVITWGEQKGSITPAHIREFAVKLVDYAAQAEDEAILVDMMKRKGMTDTEAIVWVNLFRGARREYREGLVVIGGKED